MTMLPLAFLGGVLAIRSPCILPVVPLVFARPGRGFSRETAPMLLGLAAAFTAAGMIARATAHWLLVANEIGRNVALFLLALVGLSLVSVQVAEWLARPVTRTGAPLARLERSGEAFAADEAARAAPIALPQADGQLAAFDAGTEWINSAALAPELRRGKVVLVDFWTFECYNCVIALSHVKELHAKYEDRGVVVVGVHTPEFARERIPENVRREVAKLGITYPVVIDNDNKIWNAYHNQYWPAAHFADATGRMRFYHFGEGRYEEQDKVVAQLLAERDANSTRGVH